MSIQGYDAWKTASPHDDEFDPAEAADKILKAYRKAKLNWDAPMGPWEYHLEAMAKELEILIDHIITLEEGG